LLGDRNAVPRGGYPFQPIPYPVVPVSSLNALRAVLPNHYRLWVRVALAIIVVGYAARAASR
jgi:hypothetical protein